MAEVIEDKNDQEDKEVAEEEIPKLKNSILAEPKVQIPQEINLAVSFTSQAPFARWDHFDEEMCEEASLLMVNRYHQKRKIESPEDAEAGLKEIQAWEESNLGVWESTTAEQVARIAREMLGFKNTEVVSLENFDQIKKAVAQGQPIILPTAGRELKNPNFKQPGPIYHMLVVRGWLVDGRIITNDPGTRRGKGYVYDQNVLWEALGNWNGINHVNEEKLMIVVK